MSSQLQKGLKLRLNSNKSSDTAEGSPMHGDPARASPTAFPQIGSASESPGERLSIVLDSIQDVLNQNIWGQKTLKPLG